MESPQALPSFTAWIGWTTMPRPVRSLDRRITPSANPTYVGWAALQDGIPQALPWLTASIGPGDNRRRGPFEFQVTTR